MTEPRPVLLAMDFQHAIIDRGTGHAALANVNRAIAAARAGGIPVMFVRVAFRPGYPEVSPANAVFGRLRAAGDTMTEAGPGTQLHAGLDVREGDPVIVKRRVSAFSGSDLEVLLRAAGAGHLILAGLSTSGVVLSTVRQAADLDFALTVLADACADADEEVHRVLVEKVFPRQATVLTTDEWTKTL
ncbi:cysteine hydrolase [Dactylosporangium vinaceum]|uniref:Cysteine hydrolase family protein n=1 Tax=Dactylosporangium vinaceum TaxID=53362 RepID=A0ABV5MC35_9ACTN|nr:isochorismatase family cysteine hydrolase [Dactylosporangium vinaceum]UAB92051.1 cysteine hydrolase [Dactylosporangium vinaceum]